MVVYSTEKLPESNFKIKLVACWKFEQGKQEWEHLEMFAISLCAEDIKKEDARCFFNDSDDGLYVNHFAEFIFFVGIEAIEPNQF